MADDRRDYDGIELLKTVQGRAIAMIAVDFLNGLQPGRILLGVPITVPGPKIEIVRS